MRRIVVGVGVLAAVWGAYALVVPPVVGAAVAAKVAQLAAPARAPLGEDEYVDGLMSRNLFDLAAIDAWTAGITTGAGPASEHLRLVATMRADPAELSVAAIATDDAPNLPGVDGLADQVDGRVVLSIASDRVGLRRPDGRIEYLVLASPAGSAADPTAITRLSDTERVVPRALLDQALTNPGALGRALPHRDADGHTDGFRVASIRRGSLADQLGVENGDLVRSANGRPLDSVQAVTSALSAVASEPRICVGVTRHGDELELCYDVH